MKMVTYFRVNLYYLVYMVKKIKGLVGGQRESDLKLSGQLPPCWLVFIALEGAMQAVGGEKTSVILPSAGLCVLQYQPVMQDMPTYNNGMTVIGVICLVL